MVRMDCTCVHLLYYNMKSLYPLKKRAFFMINQIVTGYYATRSGYPFSRAVYAVERLTLLFSSELLANLLLLRLLLLLLVLTVGR
jgi:hypothetical protein